MAEKKEPTTTTEVMVRNGPGLNPLLLRAKFPKDLITKEAVGQFVAVCLTTGLNPFLGEILPMHGRPYVTEQGWLRLIEQRCPGQKVYDECHLGTKEEAEELGIRSSGWLALAEVHRVFPAHPEREVVFKDTAFLSVTRVRSADRHLAAVHEEPWRLALKTGRIRCLRRAFPDVLITVSNSNYPLLGTEELPESTALPELEAPTEDTDTAERSRFFARLREHGWTHKSEELGRLLNLPSVEVGAIRAYWLPNRSWVDANERIDRLEELIARGFTVNDALATVDMENKKVQS